MTGESYNSYRERVLANEKAGKHLYAVEVDLDDRDASSPKLDIYFKVLDELCAFGTGHDRVGTSSLNFLTKKPLDIEELDRKLEDIDIIRIYKYIKDKWTLICEKGKLLKPKIEGQLKLPV